MTPASVRTVTPDLIRGPASFRTAATSSWTPDQVRGDDVREGDAA